MKSDILSALGSLGEVAVFAWSLLELLLTRIFPLLGFLTGHFLLHCFSLAAAIFTPAAATRGRSQHRLPRSRAEDEQQQELEQQRHGHLLRPYRSTAGTHERIDEILNEYELEEQKPPSAAALQALEEDLIAVGPTVEDLPKLQFDLTPSDASEADLVRSAIPANGQQDVVPATAAELGDVPLPPISEQEVKLEAVPPAKGEELLEQANDAPTSKERPIINSHVERDELELEDASVPIKSASDMPTMKETPMDKSHVGESRPWDGESSGGARPSDGVAADESVRKSGSRSRKGSMRIPRVLPPSLSQIKRTLMQRSRRAWSPPSAAASASSSSSSSASATSTPKPPTPPNFKRQSPRTRKRASAMKSSPSYDTFIRAFRKHFLLDSA